MTKTTVRPPTLQMLNFVSELFKPEVAFNGAEAYKRAYPKCKGGHNGCASRLLAKVSIQSLISTKRAEISKKTDMTVERVQTMYEEDRDFASTVNQAGARVSATTGIARLYGMDKDAGIREQTVIMISPKALKEPVIKQIVVDHRPVIDAEDVTEAAEGE